MSAATRLIVGLVVLTTLSQCAPQVTFAPGPGVSPGVFAANKESCFHQALHQADAIKQKASMSFARYSDMIDGLQAECMVAYGNIVTSQAHADAGTSSAPTLIDHVIAARGGTNRTDNRSPSVGQASRAPVSAPQGRVYSKEESLILWKDQTRYEYTRSLAAFDSADYGTSLKELGAGLAENCDRFFKNVGGFLILDDEDASDLPVIEQAGCGDMYYLRGYMEENGLGGKANVSAAWHDYVRSSVMFSRQGDLAVGEILGRLRKLPGLHWLQWADKDPDFYLQRAAAAGVNGAKASLDTYRSMVARRSRERADQQEVENRRLQAEQAAYAALPQSVKEAHTQCRDDCESRYRACRMNAMTKTIGIPGYCGFPIAACRQGCDEKFLPYKQ